MGARFNTFKIRQLTALAVAALALEATLSGLARGLRHRRPLLGGQIPAGFPRSERNVLIVLIELGLAALLLIARERSTTCFRSIRADILEPCGGLRRDRGWATR